MAEVAPGASRTTLKRTPLFELHREFGARMVAFAGYEMPVRYTSGIIAEHRHTRTAAGLFDVSHMGQAVLHADGDPMHALERLVPGDLAGLGPGRMRYTLLMNESGGIVDDLMATRPPEREGAAFIIVNAARKDVDFAYIADGLSGHVRLERVDDRALLALQGPKAAAVLGRLAPAVGRLRFLEGAEMELAGLGAFVTRSGYTGEDGFEISLSHGHAADLARRLLAELEVEPVGLGARDTLRLEAGFCLYGHDIDETITPVEASLAWTIPARRRAAADFPGAARILRQLAEGAARRRVGLRPEGGVPVREGATLSTPDGNEVGMVTSGGFGPTVEAPVAMGYVETSQMAVGTELAAIVRGRSVAVRVARLPFVEHNYYRGNQARS
ncbi:MAG: glycine cleavage system aminomethyltransferase GcvT [Alphaproteobacteria bacterium]